MTGAFGYLGRALLGRLLPDHAVMAAGRRAPGHPVPAGLASAFPYDVCRLLPADLSGYDGLVHLAGGGVRPDGEYDQVAALHDNVTAALHVAALVRKACVPRAVFVSSACVYAPKGGPLSENDPIGPDTLYGAMKVCAEAAWARDGGVVLRCATLYGAGAGVDVGRDGVMERLARAAVAGGEFTVDGTTRRRLDILHVDDAVEAIVAALHAQTPPRVLNVGSGRLLSVADLIEAFRQERREVRVRVGLAPHRISPERLLDVRMAEEALGWAPRRRIAEGVAGLLRMVEAP